MIYLGSFSKTFAAGLRVGWVLAPHAVREKLVLAAESATLCPPTFTQMLVSRYLPTHDWRARSRPTARPTGSAATRCSPRWRQHMPPGSTWNMPERRVLRVGDRARGRRHQGDAAARRHRAGRLRVGHRRSTPTASAAASCGCRTATRRRNGSPRACGGWRRCWRRAGRAAHVRQPIPPQLRRGPQAPSPSTP